MHLRGSSKTTPNCSFCSLGALALWGLIGVFAGACGTEPETARGVLLISVDSLRADHMSSYGYRSATNPKVPTTPVMDRMLAAKGVRFTNAYTTTSWTLPSHMALMTGLPNELHGVRGLPDRLHPERPYIAEVFQKVGWRTAGFWSGPNLHPFFGFDRGFEHYEDCSSSKIDDVAVFKPMNEDEFEQTVQMHEDSHEGVTGPALVAAFDEWFQGVGDDERFFALVHMWDVHYDYNAPPQYDVFDNNYRGPIDGQGFTELELKDPYKTKRGRADLNRLIALYDAEIRFTDVNVGLMLDSLSSRGRLDDTLVVFLSDHGEEFTEHEALGHKHSLFDETVRIPIIMRLPGVIPANSVVDELTSIVDLAPTILELTGLPVPRQMWGISLVQTFDGSSLPYRILPLELSFKPAPEIWRATVDGRIKVNDIPGREKLFREKLFIYNIEEDPLEGQPEIVLRNSDNADIHAAQKLWKELDDAAALLPQMESKSMPMQLEQDLNDAGYMGDDPADEPKKESDK
ncbi:MAG: arylsulfatase A-like enzyme [Planctomycetota bacterium]|jgi:arylsulfatase A-like enzyme